MRTYSSWIRSDAHAYAAQYAGASFAGKDEYFESNIGDYFSMDEYNQQMLRNREYDKVYSSSAYFWQWQTTEQQGIYRGERVRADRTKNNAQFAIAGLVINRIISAFGAVRAASRYNREHAETSQIDLYVAPNYASGDGLRVIVMTQF
jgi:hypothetical protein